jgi:putative ABC transport system permease protein
MISLFRDIADSIRSRPGKTILSFTAIGTGMTVLVILFAMMAGLREKSRLLLTELGADVFAVLPASAAEAGLTLRQANLLAANMPRAVVAPVKNFSFRVPPMKEPFDVLASENRFNLLQHRPLVRGRTLDESDSAGLARNAVVTEQFERMSDCRMGDILLLGSVPFRVVGVVRSLEHNASRDISKPRLRIGSASVFIPLTTAHACFSRRQGNDAPLDAILVKNPPDLSMEATLTVCTHLLEAPAPGSMPVSFLTPDELLHKVRRLQAALSIGVGGVILLCVLLGGTTLASLMVAGVKERTMEIGLRRALGATPLDIALLFLAEGCFVCGTAAMAGIMIALPVLLVWPDSLPLSARLTWIGWIGPLLLAILLGALSALIPARQASAISPASALRND